MKEIIINQLQEEKHNLEKLLRYAEQDKGSAPEGRLRVARSGAYPEFYHRKSKGDRLGSYIPKDQISIAQALAQKSYAEKIINTAAPKIELIEKLIREYEAAPPELLYANQTDVRKQLIKPYLVDDEEFVRRWLEAPYELNPKYRECRDQITANGELVRSKSEVIIADNLRMLGIPYKYEAPVKIYATTIHSGEESYHDF